MKYWVHLKSVPKNFHSLPFGHQIEHRRNIETFKESAKSTYVSIKRKSAAQALREFKSLYKPSEYFAMFNDSPSYWDDSFQVWYKEKA